MRHNLCLEVYLFSICTELQSDNEILHDLRKIVNEDKFVPHKLRFPNKKRTVAI